MKILTTTIIRDEFKGVSRPDKSEVGRTFRRYNKSPVVLAKNRIFLHLVLPKEIAGDMFEIL